MKNPKSLLLGLAITSLFLLLANVFVFGAFSILGLNRGLVVNTVGTVTTTTAVFIYVTWTVVYFYQILWVVYALVLVSRQRPEDPVLISPITLGTYIIALSLQVVGNTVFLVEVSFPVFVGITVSVFCALSFSCKSLYNNRFLIAKQNLRKTDSLIRGLLLNGADLYGVWAIVIFLLNLKMILLTRTNPPLNPSIAGAIVSVMFFLITFIYIISDLTIFDKFNRYTLSLYFLRIWVIGFLIPFTINAGQQIIQVLLLAFVVASLIGKLTIIFIRRHTRPLIPIVSTT